eukprot:751593-Hanusia_phi.AAC.2
MESWYIVRQFINDHCVRKALVIPLGNRTKQFHVLTIPSLPAGNHVLEAQPQFAEGISHFHVSSRKVNFWFGASLADSIEKDRIRFESTTWQELVE